MHNTVTAITKCINVLNSHALDIFFVLYLNCYLFMHNSPYNIMYIFCKIAENIK